MLPVFKWNRHKFLIKTMKRKNNNYEEPEYEDVISETKDDEFEIGQIYENHPAKKIKCKKCGCDNFIIGIGSYYTAIKCPICKWELCIHDG